MFEDHPATSFFSFFGAYLQLSDNNLFYTLRRKLLYFPSIIYRMILSPKIL